MLLPCFHMDANMSCMLYTHYVKLKDPQSLKMVPALSVHSATGCDLCPVGLTCEATIGKLQFKHTFIAYENIKYLVIGLDMQQLII